MINNICELTKHKGFKSNVKLIIGVILILSISILNAESVLIYSQINNKGQGWLFGSPKDAKCWIAVPKHVIETTQDGQVDNFRWFDEFGHEGLGTNVTQPDPNLDLAFAQVKGRKKGRCLSRLGSDDISYVINKQPVLEAIQMQTTHIEPRQMQIRDYSDELFRFVPKSKEAKKVMKPGLSGSQMFLKNSQQTPIGMIVSVDQSQEFGYAIRFDKIKSLFLNLNLNNNPDSLKPKKDISSLDFDLINSTGISRDANSTSHAMISGSGCWSVKPPKDKRSFYIDLVPKGGLKTFKFSEINIHFDERCGLKADGMVIQKQHLNEWITISTCQTIQSNTTCHTLEQETNRLRLTFIKRNGAQLGIGGILIK